MNMLNFSDSKDLTKDASIESVLSRCGLQLEKVGRTYLSFCPLHSDRQTKSLVVFTHTNSWYCFGACSRGGDGVDFIRLYYHYSYPQALKWFETNYGALNIKTVVKVEEKPARPVPNNIVGYFHTLLDECGRRPYYHSRGFLNSTINSEFWGWDGERYCIPVWEGEPGESTCLGIRRRQSELSPVDSSKYIGLKDMNAVSLWGRWHSRDAETIFAFAGELDAARAVQDGFPAISIVNGAGSIRRLPLGWPKDWFPKAQRMVTVFDKKEESFAGVLSSQWNRIKGTMMARVFHWSPTLNIKDYCQYRDEGGGPGDFRKLIEGQLGDVI